MIELEAGTIAKLQPGSNNVADMLLPTRAILTAVGNKIAGLGVTTSGNKLDLDRPCIELRYQVKFLEIGTDKDYVHFLVQSVPTYSVTKIVTFIKSLSAREIFKRCPQVKKQLWGGEFWTDGYFASTVGKHGDEQMIRRYVKNQGNEYHKLHSDHQLALF